MHRHGVPVHSIALAFVRCGTLFTCLSKELELHRFIFPNWCVCLKVAYSNPKPQTKSLYGLETFVINSFKNLINDRAGDLNFMRNTIKQAIMR